MKKAFLGVFLYIASTAIASADYCTSWGCIGLVSELYTAADGDILVATPLNEGLVNCTPMFAGYFVLADGAKNKGHVYSTLLAANIANRKVQIKVVEGSPVCEIDYVRLDISY